MLDKLGTEFAILREVPIEDIRCHSGYLIAEGIRRLREGRVTRLPGFDGEYGIIRLFEPDEIQNPEGQMNLSGILEASKAAGEQTDSGKSQKSRNHERRLQADRPHAFDPGSQ